MDHATPEPPASSAGLDRRANALGDALRPALAQAFAGKIFAEVNRVLGRAGIVALPVKGVVTGTLLYEAASQREIRDVDVRLRPQDFGAALAVARGQGWAVREVFPTYGSFIACVGGLDVDVETTVGPPGLSGLRIADMLARSVPGPTADLPRVPEIHDHALLLVVNAVKDHLVDAMPSALEDLRRIVELPRFSAERLVHLARTTHGLFMVQLVARYLRDQAAGWAHLDERLSREHPRRAKTADRLLELARGRARHTLAVRLAMRAVPDGWWRPVRALGNAALYQVREALRPKNRRTSRTTVASCASSSSG